MKDQIIEEVRANRATLTSQCGGDLKSFLAQERVFFAFSKIPVQETQTRNSMREWPKDMSISIDIFMKEATKHTAKLLGRVLPTVGGTDWWQTCVVGKLSHTQR